MFSFGKVCKWLLSHCSHQGPLTYYFTSVFLIYICGGLWSGTLPPPISPMSLLWAVISFFPAQLWLYFSPATACIRDDSVCSTIWLHAVFFANWQLSHNWNHHIHKHFSLNEPLFLYVWRFLHFLLPTFHATKPSLIHLFVEGPLSVYILISC